MARYNKLDNLNVMHLKSWQYARLILVYMFDTLFLFPSPQTKAYLRKSEHKSQVNRARSRTFSHDNWQALAVWLDYALLRSMLRRQHCPELCRFNISSPSTFEARYYTMFMNNLFRGVVNDSLYRTTLLWSSLSKLNQDMTHFQHFQLVRLNRIRIAV